MIEAVAVLARISSDDIIASVLNRNGHLTGRNNRWTRERVTALRSHHRIPCYKPDEQPSWVNLTDAAAYLDISPRTLRYETTLYWCSQGRSSWDFGKSGIGPFAQRRLDGAFGLAIGSWCVGSGASVPDPEPTLDGSEAEGTVG